MMRRPDTADAFVVSFAVGAALLDVHLHRHERRLITEALRRPVVLVGLTVLTLHAWDVLGLFDPFRAVARLIPRSVHA